MRIILNGHDTGMRFGYPLPRRNAMQFTPREIEIIKQALHTESQVIDSRFPVKEVKQILARFEKAHT